MALEEIKEKFVGVWKLDRSENFQEFLQEVGVGLPLRKMASLAKPEMTISIENDNKIKIVMKTGFFTQEDCFHLNEEFLKEMQGTLMKAIASYEDGMIKMTNTPVDPNSKVKQQVIHRERVDDEIILQIMDEIKNKFVGKWKLDRSERFEDFLRECGVNFFVRKMAGIASPVSEISVKEDDKVHISMVTSFMTQEDCFKLGEEFEKNMRGNKMVGKPSVVDEKIIIEYTPTDPSIKPQKVTREVINGELVQTMEIGDVTCKRFMKRMDSEV